MAHLQALHPSVSWGFISETTESDKADGFNTHFISDGQVHVSSSTRLFLVSSPLVLEVALLPPDPSRTENQFYSHFLAFAACTVLVIKVASKRSVHTEIA